MIPTWLFHYKQSIQSLDLDSGTLEEVHDVEFDETKGSQVENKNLEDVRGIEAT